MSVLRVAAVVAVTLGLVAGGSVAADASPALCTVTLQVPKAVKAGHRFTLTVREAHCAAAIPDDPSFFTGGGLRSGNRVSSDKIHYTHILGSGKHTYRGTAPKRAGSYHPAWDGSFSTVEYRVVTTTMRVK